jgi:hypothetical protein
MIASVASTAAAPSPDGSGGLRRAIPWLVVVAGVVVVGLVVGAPRPDDGGRPFDPSSTGPLGVRALVETIESFGAQVDVTSDVPPPDADIALMLSDVVPEDRFDAMDDWVGAGGTLVVADRFSPFAPAVTSDASFLGFAPPEVDAGWCDVAALAELSAIAPGDGTRYRVPPGASSCFGDGNEAFAVVTSHGAGAVVALASPLVFVNERLGSQDNAALAVSVLAAVPGTRVALLEPGAGAPGGDRSLAQVLNPGIRLALVQLLVAFGVYAWFRARRLGDALAEEQPVDIAGSELVVAVGHLLQRLRDASAAAELLRRDLRLELAERFGLPPDAPATVVADVVASRTGTDRDRLVGTVSDTPITSEAELVELARSVDDLRKEILHGT